MAKKKISDSSEGGNQPENAEPVLGLGRAMGRPEDGVGDRIRHARERRNWTQEALSRITKQLDVDGKGISRSVLAYYEKGRFRPGTRELRILYSALGLTPNWLVLGEEDPHRLREFRKRFESDEQFFAALIDALKKLDSDSLNGIANLAFAASANAKEFQGITDNLERLAYGLLDEASEKLAELKRVRRPKTPKKGSSPKS